MTELEVQIRRLVEDGGLSLPYPGSGQTARRHLALLALGRRDLSLGRLAEAHTDALAIMAEAAHRPRERKIYGVWASDGPQSRLTARHSDGRWIIDGTKQYCSGAGIIDAALVTAHSDEGLLLFDVPLDGSGLQILDSPWANPSLSDTATGPVRFQDITLPLEAVIGGRGWYLDRPGFWHGAIGPAACWAGGALALIDAASDLKPKEPHALAQVGALKAIGWGLETTLVAGGNEIDADRSDGTIGRKRALTIRHLVERWCTEVMDRFGQATGPQLLAHDPFVIRQHGSLGLYIRQCHAAKDLALLGVS